MEDEDVESKCMDMWNILEEQQLKDTTLSNSLKHSIDDSYENTFEKEKHLIYPILMKNTPAKNTITTRPKFTFKGYKKRILAQTRESHTVVPRNSTQLELQQLMRSNAKNSKDKKAEGKRERKITEYAQYLGLQPSARYKCTKCHTWLNGPNSKNLCACNSNMTPMPSTSESSTSVPHASNFKRKVYLCSACGTYFENWNLFLHMRDIHKRHICLFCLGMFSQAERLSDHLLKKHNLPETKFTSVEDFYNVFKGSCYLVCCSCEKVFSETDNFYNHYCIPVLKEDTTDSSASTCTLCRQTGTHASTCNFALLTDADKKSCSTTTPLTIADATRTDDTPVAIPPVEKTINFGGKGLPRKIIKHNRTRYGADDTQNARQPKSNIFTKKFGTKVRCSEIQSEYDTNVQREITNNLPRDTVTETIMEVSRYTGGNTSDENDENDEQAMNKDIHNRDRGLEDKSPAQNHQLDRNEPYDSVTETIMEVSRYTGEEGKNEREYLTTPSDIHALSYVTEKMNAKEIYDKDDCAATSSASSPTQWEADDSMTKINVTCESGIEFESQSCSSPQDIRSPSSGVSRSLFSPQHELHSSELPSNERECFFQEDDKEEKKAIMTNVTESQASVSFNTVSSDRNSDRNPDRSLVIKICNRNSQFSVATAAATTINRESEENNNANRSTSKEIMSNGSGREMIEDETNELDDSDSDSDKLAVVDSNPEGDEEAEDDEEAEEAEESGNKHDYATHEIQKENNETEIGMKTDEMFTIDGTISDGNATKKLDNNGTEETAGNDQNRTIDDDGITLAGEDVPCMDLNVEGTLDSIELEDLLKRCIEVASPTCVYCNHARYIAVNGKQLGLHMLAEHRFQPQHPAIIIHIEQFVARVKRSLDDLESHYFNLNTYNSARGTYNVPDVLVYECFHCRFYSTIHKELYLHNRKMHQKTILICIMCKSTFYSYSELLCHLCPGIYSPNVNLRYRCCLCSVNSLPSSFRLMVHLRKRHHACDVCLESTGNQQRLSNHVWKHKLHHLCYRCGIAYRNKPDITKHLFWKHGTESVLCRKCLQKKWPHIYHFCIPPTAFVCEECGSSFGRAVALKVHKRLHSGDLPYGCDECTERFISRKLLAKHQMSHKEPEPEDEYVNVTDVCNSSLTWNKDEKSDKDKTMSTTDGNAMTGITIEAISKDVKETVKKVVDVYDLPPLNLSSESDSDNEEEKMSLEKPSDNDKVSEDATGKNETDERTITIEDNDITTMTNDIVEVERNEEEKKQEARIMDGIWDNFKTYTASLDVEESAKSVALKESVPETDAAYLRSIVLADHDYHVIYSDKKNEDQETAKDDDTKKEEHNIEKSERNSSPSSPNRNVGGCDSDANKRKTKSLKKRKHSGSTSSTSDSSSDTDSSSCSCGTNCSCSSSSSGSSSSSSSSSDSDSSTSESSPRKQTTSRKERNKREREVARENKSESVEPVESKEIMMENGPMIPEVTSEPPMSLAKPLLRESDLETEETETDEDFYDEYPQLLANKLLAEKRNLLLLAAVAPASTPATESAPVQPPLNNGVLDAEPMLSDSIAAVTVQDQQPLQQKKKTKTKKRKIEKVGRRNVITTAATESIKLNIPKAFYQKNPGFAASSPIMAQPAGNRSPNLLSASVHNDYHHSGNANVSVPEMTQIPSTDVPNNLKEMENKRVSKRKRVPKRFYGDSSDDEILEKSIFVSRWRKIETPATTSTSPSSLSATMPSSLNPKSVPSRSSFSKTVLTTTYAAQTTQIAEQSTSQQSMTLTNTLPASTSTTESDDADSSSESEVDTITNQPNMGHNNLATIRTNATASVPVDATSTAERPVKIYCYCQCPYDEVSEMIACDGENCRIEWFHFECVGIMVPPKGKWYCPDCRTKHVQNSEEYCD